MQIKKTIWRTALVTVAGLALGAVVNQNQTVHGAQVSVAAVPTATGPSTITINYVPGYGIAMWNTYQANRYVVGPKLMHGTSWRVVKTVMVDGQTWYNLGGNQWIPATHTVAGTQLPLPTPTNVTGGIKINYVPGYSIAVWNSFDSSRKATGQLLKHGTSWQVTAKVSYQGQTWYRVGTKQWVQGQYTTFTDYQVTRLLGVPFIDQYANGAPYGCEGASALQAMHYKGRLAGWNLQQLLNTMPIAKDNNPYHGFAGSPYGETPGVHQTIFPQAFDPWIAKFNPVKDISGTNLQGIINQVKAGNPVVAWVTIRFGAPQYQKFFWGTGVSNLHVMTVDGYNTKTGQVHVSDPVLGRYWVTNAQFNRAYAPHQFAVAIL